MKIFLSIVFCSLLCLNAGAQKQWTLRECIDHAIEHNIEIKQQALVVENSETELNTSKNSRLPNLNANAGQSFNFGRSQSFETGIYEDRKMASSSFSVSSSIPIFSGFRISNEIKSNRLDLMAATEGLKKAMENMELQVASLYLEVLLKKELVRIYKEQLNLTVEKTQQTETLVEFGKSPESQLYEIKAQQARDELNLTTAENDLSLSLLNLTQTLNITDFTGFDIANPSAGDVIAENIGSILPPEHIYQIATGIKPHIKEAQYRLESSEKMVKVVRSGYWPSLSLNLSYNTGYDHVYNLGDDARNPSFSKQFKNNQREAIGLNLSIPIFDRLLTRNRTRSARTDITNRTLELDNIKLALYKEIQQAYQSAIAARSKYTSTEKSRLAAEESLRYTQESYTIGKATVVELNEAQTKLLSSKSDQIQAKYDFLFRAKILDFYRGIPIDIE